jgi:hypothetical protein
MTIPFLVMVVSLVIWLVFAKVPQVADPWVARVAEIVFAASVLVLLWSTMGRSVSGI